MINGTFSEYKSNYPLMGARYPTWNGFLKTQFNQVIPIQWSNMAFYGQSQISWNAKDLNGRTHSIYGNIEANGLVQFKLNHPIGTFTFTGRIMEPGRINGNWSVEGEIIAYGLFDIVMVHQKSYTIYRIAGGVPQSDNFSFALDPIKTKYVNGVGLDEVGHYLVTGKIKNKEKLNIEVTYKSKFTMHFKGKKDPHTNMFKGEWSISGGGKGEFTMIEDDPNKRGLLVPQVPEMPLREGESNPFGMNFVPEQAGMAQMVHTRLTRDQTGVPNAYVPPIGDSQGPPQLHFIDMYKSNDLKKETAKDYQKAEYPDS